MASSKACTSTRMPWCARAAAGTDELGGCGCSAPPARGGVSAAAPCAAAAAAAVGMAPCAPPVAVRSGADGCSAERADDEGAADDDDAADDHDAPPAPPIAPAPPPRVAACVAIALARMPLGMPKALRT